jgi:hypothetical protein
MQGEGTERSIAEAITARLSVYLGAHTARAAVKTFSQKALGRGPETLTEDDIPMIAEALRPVLRTFVGRTRAEIVIERIKQQTLKDVGS